MFKKGDHVYGQIDKGWGQNHSGVVECIDGEDLWCRDWLGVMFKLKANNARKVKKRNRIFQ